MSIVTVDAGTMGIIRDIKPHQLPPEAWSDGQNVRFRDGRARKFKGEVQEYGTPTVAPYEVLFAREASAEGWLYMGLDDIYHVDQSSTHTKITRASGVMTGAASDIWVTTLLHGVPVITNGVDDPQSWLDLNPASLMVDLPNWPANTTCKVMSSFLNYLVAGDITESGTRYKNRVKWSQSAAPGTLPASWDETDDTIDAGENDDLGDISGEIRAMKTLGPVHIIYMAGGAYGMRHIGGNFIFHFDPLFKDLGILAPRCVIPFMHGAEHIVAATDNIVRHSGTPASITPILNKRWRDWYIKNIDGSNFNKSFLLQNSLANEIWFCFPSEGNANGLCDLAIVWNYDEDIIGVRDLPEISGGALGKLADTTDTWSGGPAVNWDDDSETWGEADTSFSERDIMIASPQNTKLYSVDNGDQFDGSNMTSYLQRTGINVLATDRFGRLVTDNERRKLWNGVWPRISGSGTIDIRAGSQEVVGGATSWADYKTYTIGSDIKVDFCASGRFMALEFRSTGNQEWDLMNYDIDVQPLGRF